MTMPTITPDQSNRELELTIGEMTCASCAARIEKKLNKLQGVSATVNYATEKAKVSFPATLNPADLVGVVEATRYTASIPAPAADKTGTVTTGRMELADVIPAAGAEPDELLLLVGALEHASEHPIGPAAGVLPRKADR